VRIIASFVAKSQAEAFIALLTKQCPKLSPDLYQINKGDTGYWNVSLSNNFNVPNLMQIHQAFCAGLLCGENFQV
jgi:hypothetical protein